MKKNNLASDLYIAKDFYTGNAGKQENLPVEVGELWTSRQRQMHPLHYTVSYRASFKPELPDFFIRTYLAKKNAGMILDPFGGRGTTVIQGNMLGFSGVHNDLSPISAFLASSRRKIPELDTLEQTLKGLKLNLSSKPVKKDAERLSPFFHKETLSEILNLRKILNDSDDPAVRYIGLTALSRLHGHSDGFFSVYSFPQISIMPVAQMRNNKKRGIRPEYKNIKERIIRKMKRDLSRPLPEEYHVSSEKNYYTGHDARDLQSVEDESIALIVTSPPFLDKVNYVLDNWMRAWFLDVEEELKKIRLSILSNPEDWTDFMKDVMVEMGRILEPGGRAVIEVGEVVYGGKVMNLEQLLMDQLPLKTKGGILRAEKVFINSQKFTKLANCWDVKNNVKGTNSNRCLVLRKH
ncbi:MAG: site-specific DNA-methyltransferase [Spirochaetia bacterium]|nr:site-specific DNA-methyltransferase [Spirochaetia bacterium]